MVLNKKILSQIFVLTYFVFILSSCSSEKEKLIKEISESEKGLMNDTTLIVNAEKAKSAQTLYIKFADTYPTDTASASYLFKAAELSNAIHDANTAVQLLARVSAKYPDHPRSADALFMQAFLYDTELKLNNSAKEKYREFVQRYPKHPLAPSAEATLEQLESGLSDEELVKKFQQMADSANAVGAK